MIAALTLFTVLTLSILVIRSGAVALRLTGLPEQVARFQARSAFTGAGFTTSDFSVFTARCSPGLTRPGGREQSNSFNEPWGKPAS